MVAYTVHAGRRVAFVEEVVRSWETTGHTLQTGRALFTHMATELRQRVDEIHLIVRRDNEYARDLYKRIGFDEQRWVLYGPLDTEVYMTVRLEAMERKLTRIPSVSTEWEVEIGVGTRALRGEDQAWARQMYEEGHKGGRKWAQHHAHQAEHILLWDGQGVGAATGANKRVRAATCTEVDVAAPRTRCTRVGHVDERDGRALCEERSGGRVAPDNATSRTSEDEAPQIEREQVSHAGEAPARGAATEGGGGAEDGTDATRAVAGCEVEHGVAAEQPHGARREYAQNSKTAGNGARERRKGARTTKWADAAIGESTRSHTQRDDRKRGRGKDSTSGSDGGGRGDAGSAEDGTARRQRRSRRSRIDDATELEGGQEHANVQGTQVRYLAGSVSNDGCADSGDSGIEETTEAEYKRGVKRKRRGTMTDTLPLSPPSPPSPTCPCLRYTRSKKPDAVRARC